MCAFYSSHQRHVQVCLIDIHSLSKGFCLMQQEGNVCLRQDKDFFYRLLIITQIILLALCD